MEKNVGKGTLKKNVYVCVCVYMHKVIQLYI